MADIISTVLIYYLFIYWNAPYELSEKFVNLFNLIGKHGDIDRSKIRHYCLFKDPQAKLTAWQMFLRILSVPGALVGKFVNYAALAIPMLLEYTTNVIKARKGKNLGRFLLMSLIWIVKIVITFISLPVLISLVLYLSNLGYEALCKLILSPWGLIDNFLPQDVFVPFAYVAGFFKALSAGELNLLLGILGLLAWGVISAFYFATIYGILEMTTVPLWKVSIAATDTKPSGLWNRCVEELKDFFKNIRIPYICRIPSTRESNDKVYYKLDNYIYNKMNMLNFILTLVFVLTFLFIWVPISDSALPFLTNVIEFIVATGLPQLLVSFAFSSLMGLLTHKLYTKLPEKLRSGIEEKLSDAIVGITVSVIHREPPIIFTSSSGSSQTNATSGHSDQTHYF